MQRFGERVALVTGAASGIGRATVERLASEGAAIVAVDVHVPASELPAGVVFVDGDVADPATAPAVVASALGSFDRLDVLVNVAGILRTAHSHEADLDEWHRLIAVNLTGTFLFCRAAIPALLATGGGAIVNTASTAGIAGHPWAAAYAASKGGVVALTRCLAVEYGRQGIRANAVCPGGIETPIVGDFTIPDGADPRLVHRIMPLDRQRGPETVAAAIAFLASDDAAHVNGEELRVDGGTLVKFCTSLTWTAPSQYVPLARAADEHGWWGVACSDHLVNPEQTRSAYPYTKSGERRWDPFAPWPDPWVSIGAMAAVTDRVRFFTTVYILPARSPIAVAKTVGTAAVLSGNRVILGIGMGWMEEEFELMGQPFARRGRRADEMLDVVAALWRGGWVEHHGEFFDFDRLEMSPAPTERVPVWVGGLSEPALRRAARHDGWISDLQTTAELGEIAATLQRYRTELGRADEPFAVVGSAKDAVDLDGYRRLADAGVTHLVTWPWVFYSGFTDDLGARRDGIARFAEEIIGPFTSTTS